MYLADYWNPTAKWFDASEHEWKSIALPNSAGGVMVAPDASAVYFASYDGRAIYVVDPATASVVATIPLGADAPWARGSVMAVSPDSSTLFVTGDSGVLTKIDTVTRKVTGSIRLAIDGDLSSVVVSPDGRTVYTLGYYDPALFTVDAATMTLVERRATFQDPQGMQITPDGLKLLVGSAFDSYPGHSVLAAHRTIDRSILGEVSADAFGSAFGPSAMAISPDASVVYSLDADGFFSTIDVDTLATLGQVDLGDVTSAATIANIALTADGMTAVAAIPSIGVDFVDTATGVAVRQTNSGETFFAVSVVPDQAPIAQFTAEMGPAGEATVFDASTSTAAVCPVGTYDWDFGDGSTSSETTPMIEHTYAKAGDYTTQLTVTTTCGTSTQTVFTGQTALRNGGETAVATLTRTVEALATPIDPTTTEPTKPDPGTPPVSPLVTQTAPQTGHTGAIRVPRKPAAGEGSADSLAMTGADPLPLLLGAAAFSVAGAALIMARRRRPRA
ncbi:PKD domain-containing protein [Microbacterium maritypicum]|uniref:PKD domain-containing protein n=1 Tax=Microbacterium maritypicum TaxID=33918 RepID=UPI001B31BB7F|nr:PKD domain-containing protein [Microbacterium liquefaciens]MBP5800533.1 PKD domain-containing protein [Microbacterium liquefaciens]